MPESIKDFKSALPSVKNYLDPLSYIKDAYAYQKSKDKRLTVGHWSLELGFQSSSFLKMVFSGKRDVTKNLCESVSKSLALKKSDSEYLILLAEHANKTTDSLMKKVLFDRILENYKGNGQEIENKHYANFLSSSIIPILQMLIAFEDFEATTEEISKALDLSKKEVKSHLQLLEKMGLAQEVELESKPIKVWKAKNKAFKVRKDIKSEALPEFHQKTANEVKDVIKNQKIQKRLRSIFFSLPEEGFEDLLEEIEYFLTKAKNKYGSDHLNNQKIFKLNVQTYEVMKTYTKKL